MKPPPPMPIWHTSMRTPVCRYGHPLIDVRGGSHVMEYRVDGLILQTCRACQPHSYSLGVATRAHRLIFWYAVTGAQLRDVRAMGDDMETGEVLTILGYGSTHDAA